MKCMSPVRIFWDEEHQKYSYSKPKNINYEKSIVVACGKCPQCRKEWRTHLVSRVRYELDKYNLNERCFITLTCDDAHINDVFPGMSLNHSYFQKFIKRLRSYLEYHKIPHKPLKYLVCGEYGQHNTHRPHFHLILFGWRPTDMVYKQNRSKKGYKVYTSEIISKLWKAGFVEIGDVFPQTAGYMVKYIVKYSEERKVKVTMKHSVKEVVNLETGEVTYMEYMKRRYKNVFKAPVFKRWTKDKGYEYEEKVVKPPYIVYPKKMLGIDWFLENYRQILTNGYILDSRGMKHGIPKNFLKYCKIHEEDVELNTYYQRYLERLEFLFEEEKQMLINMGYTTFEQRYQYYLEQGEIRRKMYEQMKNNNR